MTLGSRVSSLCVRRREEYDGGEQGEKDPIVYILRDRGISRLFHALEELWERQGQNEEELANKERKERYNRNNFLFMQD